MDHECLKYSKSTELSCEESSFFRALIQKCLYPLSKDKDQEQKEAALRQLRNNSFFAIFMLNAGWIGFIFTLTLLKVFSVFFSLLSRGYWNVFFFSTYADLIEFPWILASPFSQCDIILIEIIFLYILLQN